MWLCCCAGGVARARRLRVRDAGGGRVARGAGAPGVAAPQPASLLARQGPGAVRAVPPHAPAHLRRGQYGGQAYYTQLCSAYSTENLLIDIRTACPTPIVARGQGYQISAKISIFFRIKGVCNVK